MDLLHLNEFPLQYHKKFLSHYSLWKQIKHEQSLKLTKTKSLQVHLTVLVVNLFHLSKLFQIIRLLKQYFHLVYL